MSLSIFNSKKLKSWFFTDIAIALLAIGSTELALHISAPAWLLNKNNGDFRSDVIELGIQKAEQLDRVDVAVVGSSVSNAIDPDLLSKTMGSTVSVEDFVLYSADSNGTLQMSEKIILLNIAVDWLVYVVSPRDINALSNVANLNENIPDIEAYTADPTAYKIRRLIEKNFYLYRYRSAVLNIASWSVAAKPVASPEKKDEQGAKGEIFTDFELSSRFLSDVEALNALCKRTNTHLAIIVLPTNPAEQTTSADFQEKALAWAREIGAFSHDRNITFINAFDFITQPTHFKDSHHLSPEGERLLTYQVNKALSAATFP